MNTEAVEKIANAVLYEGYLLYPYRPSAVKNRQRFNFGVLYPREFCEDPAGSDAWEMQTECLASGSPSATVEVTIRFLQMVAREGRQEGIERCLSIPRLALHTLATLPFSQEFRFRGEAGESGRADTIAMEVSLAAAACEERVLPDGPLWKLTLRIRNQSQGRPPRDSNRDEVLLRSAVSVHSIFHVTGAAFISLLDPPEDCKAAALACRNMGAWPVLVGDAGQRDTILASPIILYDYPEIAQESAGDLFDGTEIDEILALRILTLSDAEKLEVMNGDERARRILERTEMLPPEHFQKLHGALRGLR